MEELDDINVEFELFATYIMHWTCPHCQTKNSEYNIRPYEEISCNCNECGEEYSYTKE